MKLWRTIARRLDWHIAPVVAVTMSATCSPSTAQTLRSGAAVLSFPQGASGRGVRLQGDGDAALSAQPARIFVCTDCSDLNTDQTAVGAAYSSVAPSGDAVKATAQVTTASGSTFQLQDTYQAAPVEGSFTLDRQVTVLHASAVDHGFNSQFAIGFASPLPLPRYHALAPAIWYDRNANANPNGIASPTDISKNPYLYWRETRSALPFIMLQDPSGASLTLAHVGSTASSGIDETNPSWIVDASVQYGSLGAQNVPTSQASPNSLIGFIYPAVEGDGNYVDPNVSWSRRSHPTTQGFTHSYKLMLTLDRSANYHRAIARTWRTTYDVFNPPTTTVPSQAVVAGGLNVLTHYYHVGAGNAAGFPFSVYLDPANKYGGAVGQPSGYQYEMGYVGQQIPLAFQLLRRGRMNSDASLVQKGISILDFWANTELAQEQGGLPLTEYDADAGHFTNNDCTNPLFMRTLSDGMEGVLAAAIYERTHKGGTPHPNWEKFAQTFGDWLVTHQLGKPNSGAFYRAYNPDGSVFTNTGKTVGTAACNKDGFGPSLFDTTHPIRFLAMLYVATGNRKYLQAAEAAGRFALDAIYGPTQYVGGVIDNPNVIDKPAGFEAMHAALALYDVTGGQQWLTAAQQAADFTQTWMYSWPFNLYSPPPAQAYAYAGNRATSLVATGQSSGDIALSYESYDFYRLSLFGEQRGATEISRHNRAIALQLESNTKLTTQLANVTGQQFGYPVDGLVSEAVTLANLRTADAVLVGWLPWLTNAELDPEQRLEDTFGGGSIAEVDQQPRAKLFRENRSVYPAPGKIGWGTSP